MAKGVKPAKPKVEANTEHESAGQPTLYKKEYNVQVYRLCLLGATDKDIATFYEVTETTINNWKIAYPKFFESIKRGKQHADAKVAESLYKRACGYSHSDVDIKVIDSEIIQTKLIKHYPPDATSGIFWLKNRQPDKWRDKQEIDHGGQKGNPILTEQRIIVEDMTDGTTTLLP